MIRLQSAPCKLGLICSFVHLFVATFFHWCENFRRSAHATDPGGDEGFANFFEVFSNVFLKTLARFFFPENRSRRCDRFRQKIVKIGATLAIFRPFEDFGDFRFDRFDIFFDSIDTEPNDRWGPPWLSRPYMQVFDAHGSKRLQYMHGIQIKFTTSSPAFLLRVPRRSHPVVCESVRKFFVIFERF